jgi:pantoate--beta-alanine ligase
MVEDLGLPIGISVCPTIREPDGLAMSSRNAYLSAAERRQAVGLHESLELAEKLWTAGEPVDSIEGAMRAAIEAREIRVDYAAVVDPDSLAPLATSGGPAVALVAGRLGGTRLIDNRILAARG